VQENGYGDGFGWKFLVDAALTATRIRSHAREEVQYSNRTVLPRSASCARAESKVERALYLHHPSVPCRSVCVIVAKDETEGSW